MTTSGNTDSITPTPVVPEIPSISKLPVNNDVQTLPSTGLSSNMHGVTITLVGASLLLVSLLLKKSQQKSHI